MRLINADQITYMWQEYKDGEFSDGVTLQSIIRRMPTIEVVRCMDCKFSRPIDKTKSPEKYFKDDCIICECEDVVGDESMVYPPSHFCSYGKNKYKSVL